MPKCDFNKAAKFAAYFPDTFFKEDLWMDASRYISI